MNQQQQDLLQEKPKQASQIDNLFKLDVKTDNLKAFLENMSSVINNQSIAINQLNSHIKQKADKTQVSECFERIGKNVSLHDQTLIKNVNTLMNQSFAEHTGDQIDDAANKSANKFALLGHACHYIYKGNTDWDNKLKKVEQVLHQKCDIDQMKQKVKKNKKKILNEIEELRRKLQKQMDDLQRKTQNSMSKFEVSLKETEKKTLWKIQDAEALLQKRVTSEFVDNTCKQLEEKILRELAKQKEENFGSILRDIEDLTEKVKHVDTNHTDKHKSLKKQLQEMENMFLHKLCNIETFENNKKMVFEKFGEIDQKLIQLDQKGSANDLFQTTKNLIKDLELKILKLDREEKQLEVRVNELDIKVQIGGQKEGEGNSLSDPHKICLLESDLKRLKDEVESQKQIYQALESDLKRQFSTLEHKVLSNFALLRNQDNNTISRDEAANMDDRLRIVFEERNKNFSKDLEDLKGRVAQFQDLEKRFKKRMTDMTNNNDFLKQLQTKADDEEVRREFAHTDEKVKSLMELVNQFRREFESIEQFYNQLSGLLKNNQQETISIITGNQKIIPNKCLTCGTKGRQTHHTHDMKGHDGRIYRGDISQHQNTSMYENQEVFDILPSQILHQEVNSKMGMGYPVQQFPNSQFRDRPMSAKTDTNENHLPIIKENNKNGENNRRF